MARQVVPLLPLVLSLAACHAHEATVGAFVVDVGKDGLDVTSPTHPDFHLDGLRFLSGTASADVEMRYGAFLFTDVDVEAATSSDYRLRPQTMLLDVTADGEDLGIVQLSAASDDALVVDWSPVGDATWAGVSAGCDDDGHFLGLGAHAFDVDHAGEAFSLWTSEPGIGKVDTDVPPDDWFLEGTRHATSFPAPWVVRTEQSSALLLDTTDRVDVDLCATDPERFSLGAWSPSLRTVVFAEETPLAAVSTIARATGLPPEPEPYDYGPWNDAIRGSDRVRAVAAELRSAGAPSSAIWTEDWKGGEDGADGYHLTGEWFVDDSKYPDADALADELQGDGFLWLAYFAPFVVEGTRTWDDAVANDALIQDADGEPYTFSGPSFEPYSMVDLTSADARAWAESKMQAAVDVGFDGWMADYAEWLPTDAVLASGESPWEAHDSWPLLWQQTNLDVLGPAREAGPATWFVRSGWTGSAGMAPVFWGGDQRTSFDADDGLPTVVPLGLGLADCGVAMYGSDVAGYQTVGNPPSTKELWFRWAELGAFSPVMRTHHGARDAENWQFDTDADTLAHWARYAREHVRLYPYLAGLGHQAAQTGTPILRPIGVQFPGEDVARFDAWMLGPSLLVAPVVAEGATSRDVDLPASVGWYDWWTRTAASSGTVDAPVDAIPVFAASGSVVPTFGTIPDTLIPEDGPLLGLDDVDGERVVYVFGGGGTFTEADGTTYTVTGTPSEAGDVTQTLAAGDVAVGGATVTLSGTTSRSYEIIVVP